MVVKIRCRESCGAVLRRVTPGPTADSQVGTPFAGRRPERSVLRPGAPIDSGGELRRLELTCRRCGSHHVFREDRVFDAVARARAVGRTSVYVGDDGDLGG